MSKRFADEAILTQKGETDSYEMSTAFAIWTLYQDFKARYQFIFRTPNIDFPRGFVDALREQVRAMMNLTTSPGLAEFYKARAPWIKPQFIDDFFGHYRFDPDEIVIGEQDGYPTITTEIIPFWRAIHWPYRLMPLVNELKNQMLDIQPDKDWENEVKMKWHVWRKHYVPVAEFGLRRRAYGWMHKRVLEIAREIGGLKQKGGVLLGTSDIQLAYELDLTPMGTQDHAWIQFHAALYGYREANIRSMEAWLKVFPDNPGYVLTDTYTNQAFLKDFYYEFASRFTGPRPDSGDEYANTDLFVRHYRNLGIDPRTKGIIYSNGLGLWKPVQLTEYAENRTQPTFGIGTFLTNDPEYFSQTSGYKSPDYVMKLVEVIFPDGRVKKSCKLTDNPEKATGDPEEIVKAKAELGIG